MKKENKWKVDFIKHELNSQKDSLIDSMHALEEIDKKEAEKLGKIIGRLEQWQNS